MPKGTNQKLKLYRLYRIMIKETDAEHGLTMHQILERLAQWQVTTDRKTLYNDLAALQELGLKIQMTRTGNEYYYHVEERPFELAELKLLVDAVQSSKFITARKSRQLIKKLTAYASNYEERQLNREVIVAGRIKAMNESIYYNVDTIHHAMAENRQITFAYLQWNLKKELVPRKKEPYQISPWALTWDNENYYLIGYDAAAGMIKNYRVDKMDQIALAEEKRTGRNSFAKLDMAVYTRENFGMYHGEETKVKLCFENALAGVLIDRFGKDIEIRKVDEVHSETTVSVCISGMFFGWITGVGEGLEIVSPLAVKEQYQDYLRNILKQYQ